MTLWAYAGGVAAQGGLGESWAGPGAGFLMAGAAVRADSRYLAGPARRYIASGSCRARRRPGSSGLPFRAG